MIVAGCAHSCTAADLSQQKATRSTPILTRIIHRFIELTHNLGVSVAQFAQYDHGATSHLAATTPS